MQNVRYALTYNFALLISGIRNEIKTNINQNINNPGSYSLGHFAITAKKVLMELKRLINADFKI